MPITVKVQPDLSAFRQTTSEELAQFLIQANGFHTGLDPLGSPEWVAQQLLKHFTILPK